MFDFIEQAVIMEVISEHINDDPNDMVNNILVEIFDEYKYYIADEIFDMTGHYKALYKVFDFFVDLMTETIINLIELYKSARSHKVLFA